MADQTEHHVGRIPIFTQLLGEQRRRVVEAMERRDFAGGASVARRGTTLRELHLVVSGALRVTDPADSDASALGPGDYFGELAPLEPRPAARTIVAAEPSTCLVLTEVGLRQAMQIDPAIALVLLKTVTRRLPDPEAAEGLPVEPTDRTNEQLMKYADAMSRVFQQERRRRAELRETIMDVVKMLVQVGEAKDVSLAGHGARIARYAQIIARRLGWDEMKVGEAALAGLLHDVGNVAIDTSVLVKSGNLTDREWAQVQAHAEVGARLLGGIEILTPLVPYVQHHHERFDGHGYPQGLRGRAIPTESRLIAAAGAVEMLLRPGRARLSPADVQLAIRREAGRQLDPEMAAAVIQALGNGELTAG